jgi:1,4-alpha-glucan branching enzyme
MVRLHDLLGGTMRILHVTTSYPPAAGYAISKYISELARSLKGLGHDVHVLAGTGTNESGRDDREGIPTHLIRTGYPFFAYNDYLQTVLTNLPLGERLLEVWKSDGPFDIVASHDWSSSMAASLAQRVYGVPLVVTLHGTQSGKTGGKGTREEVYVSEMEKWFYERADRVIVLSRHVRSELEKNHSVAPARIAVIPGGVRADSFKADVDREEFRSMFAESDEPLLLFAGRLSPEKGPDLLLEAMAGLVRSGVRGRLVLAGNGPLEPVLKKLVEERGLGDRVRLTGFLGNTVLGALYSVADLLVVPSRYESFGTVILEALAHGLPVVASQCESISELATAVKRDALKPVPRNDVHALERILAQEISTLRRQPDNRSPRQNRIPAAFAWENVAPQILNLYQSLSVPANT